MFNDNNINGWTGGQSIPSGASGTGGGGMDNGGLVNQIGNGVGNFINGGTRPTTSPTGGPQIGNPAFLSGTIFGIPTWLVLAGALAFYMMERKK
jgi:hypothetical protein